METKIAYNCAVCGKVYQKKFYYDKHVLSHSESLSHSKIKKKNSIQSEPETAPESTSTQTQPTPAQNELGDLDDGDLPFIEGNNVEPLCLKEEDEAEEARRLIAATVESQPSNQPKKSKKALVKCTMCKPNISFYTLDGFVKHKMSHVFAEKLLQIPEVSTLMLKQRLLMKEALQDAIKQQTKVGFGPQIICACDALLNLTLEEDKGKPECVQWNLFVSHLTKSLYECFESGSFSLPSVLKEKYFTSTAVYLRDLEKRSILKNYLQNVIPEHCELFNMLIPTLIRIYSYKVLVFVLKTINQSCKQQAILTELYAVTKQITSDIDFKQNMHYIGGANIKSVLRKCLTLKHPRPHDIKIISILRERFLVGEFSGAPDPDLVAWTLSQDRGGLLKMSAKALDFFVALGCIIKPLEHFDGSLYADEVIEKVMGTMDLVLSWDDLVRGKLSAELSFILLYRLCTNFCNTWRAGIVGRRKDELSKKTEVKHGTQGVAFRAKLST